MRRDSCGFDAVVGWERGTVGPLCKTLSGCEILSDSMLGGTAAARRMAGHSEPRVGLWQRVAVQIEKLRFGVETRVRVLVSDCRCSVSFFAPSRPCYGLAFSLRFC